MNRKGKVICLIIVFIALCALLLAVCMRNMYAHWSDDLEGWHYNDN